MTQLVLFEGVTVTDTSLTIKPSVSYEDWLSIGDRLGQIGRAHQWWIGDWILHGERKWGEKYTEALDRTGLEYDTLRAIQWVAGRVETVRRRTDLSFSHHREIAALDPVEQDAWLNESEARDLSVHDLRRELRGRRELAPPPLPEGKYAAIVIDPPWPVEKILREVRPKQGPALDYPVMQLDEIAALPIPDLASEGTHVYLWTTHKFLPAAFDLFDAWGVRYECLMTWVKNVGMTPFSWMYDTEHVLFGRIGSLELATKGQRLSFQAPVDGHSVKPDVFYERVIAASPAPRLEMFARRDREGFTVWGNEVAA